MDPLRDGVRAGATESVRGVAREGLGGRHRKVVSLAVPLSWEGVREQRRLGELKESQLRNS